VVYSSDAVHRGYPAFPEESLAAPARHTLKHLPCREGAGDNNRLLGLTHRSWTCTGASEGSSFRLAGGQVRSSGGKRHPPPYIAQHNVVLQGLQEFSTPTVTPVSPFTKCKP